MDLSNNISDMFDIIIHVRIPIFILYFHSILCHSHSGKTNRQNVGFLVLRYNLTVFARVGEGGTSPYSHTCLYFKINDVVGGGNNANVVLPDTVPCKIK